MKHTISQLLLKASLLIFITSCATMQSRWEATKSVDTTQAYEEFLRQYPKGELSNKARERLKELYEQKDWENSKAKNTITAYEKFLRDYPNSRYVQNAMANIKQLKFVEERTKDYQQALDKDTIEAFSHFLKKYYIIKKQTDGEFVLYNAEFVNNIISHMLSHLEAAIYPEKSEDPIPIKFNHALEEVAVNIATRPSPLGLEFQWKDMQISIGPERFGANPLYMISDFPLPKGCATFRDLNVELSFDENGRCSKKVSKYSRGSIIILENSNMYIYDGKKWCGPY